MDRMRCAAGPFTMPYLARAVHCALRNGPVVTNAPPSPSEPSLGLRHVWRPPGRTVEKITAVNRVGKSGQEIFASVVFFADVAVKCCDLLAKRRKFGQHFHIDLLVQGKDLELGLQVHLIVLCGLEAVAGCLPVLRHHDDRCLNGGKHGQKQVEKDERVGIERARRQYDCVDQRPEDQEKAEAKDKSPGAAYLGDIVGQPVAETGAGGKFRVGVARNQLFLV
ncbi:hypothetical protein AT6N2_C0620 [Agrobacterium tumefaciens]|nr:hypothetical protein AT6N2_C0620 [Agrobacterium tumefaciens]